jgi:hypothetical protein
VPALRLSSDHSERTVARSRRVAPSAGAGLNELHYDCARLRNALVPDEMDGSAAYVHEGIRPVGRVHLRRVGRIVAVVDGHRARRDGDRARCRTRAGWFW